MSYSRHGMGEFLLCLDTETTGSSFKSYEETFSRYQAISFGAVIARCDTLEPVKELYFELKYDPKYAWSEEAEKIHGLSREHLEQNGITAEEGAVELANFLMDVFGVSKVPFLGHNPHFDIHAMRQLLEPFGIMPELYHVVMDTSAGGFLAINKTKSNDIFNIFLGGRQDTHNALDDAKMTLATARAMRQVFTIGLDTLGVKV